MQTPCHGRKSRRNAGSGGTFLLTSIQQEDATGHKVTQNEQGAREPGGGIQAQALEWMWLILSVSGMR